MTAPKEAKTKPETSAALDRIAEACDRLGVASIAEYVRELHRRPQDGKR